jgi:coproporphyrinogen III oxidase
MSTPSPSAIKAWLLDLQQRIVAALEEVDGKPFLTDSWERPEGGGGMSRLIEEGNVLERGGVNFSHVTGANLPPSAAAARPELAGRAWEAMGVSLVLHPRNPYAPTVHMNVRFFEATAEGQDPVWWFGGGMDLTPYYGNVDDARHFHQVCHDALAPYGDTLHPASRSGATSIFISSTARKRAASAASFSTTSTNCPSTTPLRWCGASATGSSTPTCRS